MALPGKRKRTKLRPLHIFGAGKHKAHAQASAFFIGLGPDFAIVGDDDFMADAKPQAGHGAPNIGSEQRIKNLPQLGRLHALSVIGKGEKQAIVFHMTR